MPIQLPLRKIFQKRAPGAPHFAISLSGTMVVALSLVLAACVAWAFFMGFMVGKGQNPGAKLQSMTGIALTDESEKDTDLSKNVARGIGEAESGSTRQDGASEQPYPFTSPEGESKAAWGDEKPVMAIKEPPKNTSPKSEKARAREREKRAEPAKTDNGQIYNYSYQVAAYKSANEANKLNAKLEKAGHRASVQKSGKVHLVLVKLRGTESDAAKLRARLENLKLGKPLQLSKKPVEGKQRAKGGK